MCLARSYGHAVVRSRADHGRSNQPPQMTQLDLRAGNIFWNVEIYHRLLLIII